MYQYFVTYVAEEYSIIWLYHNLFTHCADAGHFAIVNKGFWLFISKVAINTPVQAFFVEIYFYFSWINT